VREADEALAARAPGDRQAFTELYRRYIDPVYRYMAYQAPTDEAQDLAAQVFFHAYRAASQFRGDGASYRAWLFRIAHNTVATWRRRSATRPTPVKDLPEAGDESADPAILASHRELAREVWSAVAELSAPERELVELRFVEGMGHKEIAAVTGSSDGAVRVRLHRLMRRLRRRLEGKEVRQ
jgi:RNA polymerase sigma-70 factor (ECF subfamily)